MENEEDEPEFKEPRPKRIKKEKDDTKVDKSSYRSKEANRTKDKRYKPKNK